MHPMPVYFGPKIKVTIAPTAAFENSFCDLFIYVFTCLFSIFIGVILYLLSVTL